MIAQLEPRRRRAGSREFIDDERHIVVRRAARETLDIRAAQHSVPDREVVRAPVEPSHAPVVAAVRPEEPARPTCPQRADGDARPFFDPVDVEPHRPAVLRGDRDMIPCGRHRHRRACDRARRAIVGVVLELSRSGHSELVGEGTRRPARIRAQEDALRADDVRLYPHRDGVGCGRGGVGDIHQIVHTIGAQRLPRAEHGGSLAGISRSADHAVPRIDRCVQRCALKRIVTLRIHRRRS